MSVFGVTSYALVTAKGKTFIPFVRGTGFSIAYRQTSFYSQHILTAAHVAQPQRYAKLFGNPYDIQHVRERHVSSKLHLFHPDGSRYALLPLDFKVHRAPRADVALLRIEREGPILTDMQSKGLPAIVPFEIDTDGLTRDEPVVVKGLHMTSEQTLSDMITMVPQEAKGTLAAKYVSDDLGTVLIGNLTSGALTPGMHGAPVLRESNGKLVGVLVGDVWRQPRTYDKPPKQLGTLTEDKDKSPEVVNEMNSWRERNMHAPGVDISSNGDLLNQVPAAGFAFVPVGEFYTFLRQTESL
jgi:hypothetical protein